MKIITEDMEDVRKAFEAGHKVEAFDKDQGFRDIKMTSSKSLVWATTSLSVSTQVGRSFRITEEPKYQDTPVWVDNKPNHRVTTPDGRQPYLSNAINYPGFIGYVYDHKGVNVVFNSSVLYHKAGSGYLQSEWTKGFDVIRPKAVRWLI